MSENGAVPAWAGKRWVDLHEVDPRQQSFLWRPYVPYGVVTLVAGDGGLGKSYASLALASCVTNGVDLTIGKANAQEPGNVLLMSTEDNLDTVIVPRLIKLGADRRRVRALNFELSEGLVIDDVGIAEVEAQVAAIQPRLVIVDPIVHFLGDDKDMHRANEVRGVMTRLNALAARNPRTAVKVLAHVNKNEKARASYRVMGSADFRNAVRSMLVVGWVEEEPERGRAIFHDKANGSQVGPPIGFDIVADSTDLNGVGLFRWQQTDLTKAEVFGGSEPKTSKGKLAAAGLAALLADGRVLPSDYVKDVLKMGGFISDRTIIRAAQNMGVVIDKHADGTSLWRLGGPDAPSTDDVAAGGL